MLREKFYLTWRQIVAIKVPQYNGLRVKDIIKFATDHIDIKKFLPKYNYEKEPNREWLCNIVNSLLTEDFNAFIEDKISIRKQELIKSQNISVSVKPEFVKYSKTLNQSQVQRVRAISLQKCQGQLKTKRKLEH